MGLGHWTYLAFELGWALPVIALQWAVGRATLRANWRLMLLGALVPTIYFSLADAVAIAHGIWTLNAGRITGLRLGPLPLEEAVFFLLTNTMVAQGYTLFTAPGPEMLRRFRRSAPKLRNASADASPPSQ